MSTQHQDENSQVTRVSRRQFLKITAVAGSLAGLGALGVDALLSGETVHRVQTTRLLLGTVANLTLITDRPSEAEAALEAACSSMTEFESVLSRFKSDSQITQLNVSGTVEDPHPALSDVLARAEHYSELTHGAFDVTIEPVLALYRWHADQGTLPDSEAVLQARELVDYRKIVRRSDRITLQRQGMAVTLDGIAKGYIIDRGSDELRRRGFENILVELGGDMQASGMAGDRPWRISLQSPRQSTTAHNTPVTQIQDRALATSGDYMQFFSPDFRLHHILNPDTGDSPLELSSASVIAPTTCDADALATAAMVMGADQALALLAGLPDTEGLLIRKDGTHVQTAAFPQV